MNSHPFPGQLNTSIDLICDAIKSVISLSHNPDFLCEIRSLAQEHSCLSTGKAFSEFIREKLHRNAVTYFGLDKLPNFRKEQPVLKSGQDAVKRDAVEVISESQSSSYADEHWDGLGDAFIHPNILGSAIEKAAETTQKSLIHLPMLLPRLPSSPNPSDSPPLLKKTTQQLSNGSNFNMVESYSYSSLVTGKGSCLPLSVAAATNSRSKHQNILCHDSDDHNLVPMADNAAPKTQFPLEEAVQNRRSEISNHLAHMMSEIDAASNVEITPPNIVGEFQLKQRFEQDPSQCCLSVSDENLSDVNNNDFWESFCGNDSLVNDPSSADVMREHLKSTNPINESEQNGKTYADSDSFDVSWEEHTCEELNHSQVPGRTGQMAPAVFGNAQNITLNSQIVFHPSNENKTFTDEWKHYLESSYPDVCQNSAGHRAFVLDEDFNW